VTARTFTDVSLVAEHVPETHRTLENDLTVTERELPGMVTVYLVIDGGRLPFTQLRGADVLEAIERAGKQQQTQARSAPAAPETPAPAGPEPQPETPAPETPQE
jgi:hypothetical protein